MMWKPFQNVGPDSAYIETHTHTQPFDTTIATPPRKGLHCQGAIHAPCSMHHYETMPALQMILTLTCFSFSQLYSSVYTHIKRGLFIFPAVQLYDAEWNWLQAQYLTGCGVCCQSAIATVWGRGRPWQTTTDPNRIAHQNRTETHGLATV